MRYFLISYAHPKGFGDMVFEYPKIIERAEILKFAARICDCKEKDIVIISIYEFKTKEDYKDFAHGGST